MCSVNGADEVYTLTVMIDKSTVSWKYQKLKLLRTHIDRSYLGT